MSGRLAAVLVALLVVLGAGALYYHRQQSEQQAPNAALLGQPVLENLKAADIAAIRIAGPESTLTLEQKGGRWTIAERGDFPADTAKVRRFVVRALELKIGQSERIAAADRGRLHLDGTGVRVDFLDAAGKPVSGLVVGEKYFKSAVDDKATATPDGRFVMRPSDPGRALIVADPLAQASTKSADWIDRTGFKVEKVKSLELRYPDGKGWRLERSGDNADWKLAGAPPAEKLETTKANAASYSLSLLSLDDVAPPKAADTGLDKPTLIHAVTLSGVSWDIKVGNAQGKDYYLSFSTSSDDKNDQLLSQYVLLVPKSTLEDTLIRRSDLLKKNGK